MISYETAKKLKDAGFPLAGNPCKRCAPYFDGDLGCPTLSELIAACGVHSAGLPVFKQLNWHATARQTPFICQTPQGSIDMKEAGEWCAKARIGKGLAGHISAWGKTAEEAVAKLWLASSLFSASGREQGCCKVVERGLE